MTAESVTDSDHSPRTTKVIQDHILPNRPALEIFPSVRISPKDSLSGRCC